MKKLSYQYKELALGLMFVVLVSFISWGLIMLMLAEPFYQPPMEIYYDDPETKM